MFGIPPKVREKVEQQALEGGRGVTRRGESPSTPQGQQTPQGLPEMAGPEIPGPKGRLARIRAKGVPAPDQRDEQEEQRSLQGRPT